jgi:hypothetical protein
MTLCPLGQPEKAIDHESQIEPWLAPDNRPACQFQTPNGVVTTIRMKPLGWKNQIASPDCAIGRSSGMPGQNKSFLHYVGWMSGQKNLRLPVAGEVFLLTSLFIELIGSWPQQPIGSRSSRQMKGIAHPKDLLAPTWPTTRSIEASSRHRGNTVSLGAEPCGSTGGFCHTLFIMAHIEYQP